jgi:hypothetical protein
MILSHLTFTIGLPEIGDDRLEELCTGIAKAVIDSTSGFFLVLKFSDSGNKGFGYFFAIILVPLLVLRKILFPAKLVYSYPKHDAHYHTYNNYIVLAAL